MDFLQIGGGACSLCGAEGTNKTTCPLNKEAKHPNPAKHNVGKSGNVKADAKKAVVKKDKSAFKTTTQYHNVKVILRNEDDDYTTDLTAAEAKKIIDWYNKRMAGSDGYFTAFIKDFKMKHIKKNLFEVSYKQIGDIMVKEIIDPDDDGNHPIKMNGTEYIVIGRLL